MNLQFCWACGAEFNSANGEHICDIQELARRVAEGSYRTDGERDGLLDRIQQIRQWEADHPDPGKRVGRLPDLQSSAAGALRAVNSPAQQEAARRNGRKGGRPKRSPE